ncbi:MAG: prolipoprotein diacylglyceryl transferase [Bacilli bacterium]|nr:prolipoprotein diacylglyceryl transferase [Bacilli bacterium]
MDRVAFKLGFISIYWYSLFILSGVLVALFFIIKEAKRKNIKADFLIDLIFKALIFGIIGARIYYVIFNFSYYISNPIEIFQIWHGGLAIHGALIAGLIVTYLCTKKEKIDFIELLDILVVGIIIGQAIGRWGNFFNQEAYGNITTLSHLKALHIPNFIIKNMYILGEYRQPTFLYESLFCLLGFVIMIIVRNKFRLHRGFLLGFYLVWYGVLRFIIESMRSDSLMLGPIKMAQIVSIIFILFGIYMIFRKEKKSRK